MDRAEAIGAVASKGKMQEYLRFRARTYLNQRERSKHLRSESWSPQAPEVSARISGLPEGWKNRFWPTTIHEESTKFGVGSFSPRSGFVQQTHAVGQIASLRSAIFR